MDRVYYFLGFNYGELGDRKTSLLYLKKLTEQHPESPFVAEAYRELGDAFYNDKEYRQAMAYYELALRAKPRTQPTLLHKLAWTYYRTKQFNRAVETMKKAITAATEEGESQVSLREEALRDMAIFMTEAGRVEDALAYFQAVAGDKEYFPTTLERLGREYERILQQDKAIKVYETILKTYPEDEAAFRVIVKLVELEIKKKNYGAVSGLLARGKIPSSLSGDTEVSFNNLKAIIRRTATQAHAAYRKNPSREQLLIAERFYALYLQELLSRDDPRGEKGEIQMYLAEVKRDLGKKKEASALYREIVEKGDDRFKKDAAANWVGALSETLKAQSSAGSVTSGKARPTETEVEFVKASDQLQERIEGSIEAREAAIRSAQLLAGYSETQEDALKRARDLVKRHPGSPQGLTAARLWVQILSDRVPDPKTASESDFASRAEDLAEVCKDLKSNAALIATDRKQGGKLVQLIEAQENRLSVSLISIYERKKDYKSAARAYERFAEGSKDTELAEKSYQNAISNYVLAGDRESSERMLEQWQTRFPRSKKLPEQLRVVATQQLIQGEFKGAVVVFERISRDTGDGESLETAARISEALGDGEHAQKLWADWIKRFGTRERARVAGVQLTIGKLQEKAGSESAASKWYQECLKAGGPVGAECGARLGDLFLKSKDQVNARKIYAQVSALGSRTQSPYIGYARYQLADFEEQRLKFAPLALPEVALQRGITERLNGFQRLSKSYTEAAEAGGPYAIASLHRLARWTLNFAEEVEGIRPSDGMVPAAQAKFQEALSSVSKPLRKKAGETWSQAYRRAAQAEALSPINGEIADQLADLKISPPGRAQGYRARWKLAGLPPDGGKEGRDEAFTRVRATLMKDPKASDTWIDYGNLLWGEGKPMLARLAYEQALALKSTSAAALNNSGVALLTSDGPEDWVAAADALARFRKALKDEPLLVVSKINIAILLNYYRLFERAKPLWEQVLAKYKSVDAWDGLGIAQQGSGSGSSARESFEQSKELGASKRRYAALYHEAARRSSQGTDGASECLALLEEIDTKDLEGFIADAVKRLKETCERWKTK
jgi:tetratricopeptide (TPR) repeat protein